MEGGNAEGQEMGRGGRVRAWMDVVFERHWSGVTPKVKIYMNTTTSQRKSGTRCQSRSYSDTVHSNGDQPSRSRY